MGRRGVGAVSFLREQLASTDMDVPHVGLSTLRDEGGGTPRDECGISYREYGAGVYSPAGNDRSAVEECAGGRVVCAASVTRGIGCVGGGEEGCAQRVFWTANVAGLYEIRGE